MRQDFILYAEIEEYVRLRFASSDVYNTAILFGGLHMPYVIAEPCIGVKDKSCVAVCPVDCIHEADDQPSSWKMKCPNSGSSSSRSTWISPRRRRTILLSIP
jgi:NAD-dependent dihydropyrimidine dehydrogenase PreA subunit